MPTPEIRVVHPAACRAAWGARGALVSPARSYAAACRVRRARMRGDRGLRPSALSATTAAAPATAILRRAGTRRFTAATSNFSLARLPAAAPARRTARHHLDLLRRGLRTRGGQGEYPNHHKGQRLQPEGGLTAKRAARDLQVTAAGRQAEALCPAVHRPAERAERFTVQAGMPAAVGRLRQHQSSAGGWCPGTNHLHAPDATGTSVPWGSTTLTLAASSVTRHSPNDRVRLTG